MKKKAVMLAAGAVLSVVAAVAMMLAVPPSDETGPNGCHTPAYNGWLMRKLAVQAQLGDAYAAYKLSVMYQYGQERDPEKHLSYLMTAANAGHSGAEEDLANYYLYTFSKPMRSQPGAVTCGEHADDVHKWLMRAAEHGSYTAQRAVSLNYYVAECGFPLDAVEAYKWDKIGGDADANLRDLARQMKMTKKQVDDAQRAASQFHARPHDAGESLQGIERYNRASNSCCTYGKNCDDFPVFE